MALTENQKRASKFLDSETKKYARESKRLLNEAAQDMLNILERLTEKVVRANNIRHSGGRVIAEDWSELWQLTNESKAVIAKAKGE